MPKNNLNLFINSLILVLFLLCNNINAIRQQYVTCGSVLKLLNTDYKVRLHSHDVKYGTGSGQQSVTGVDVPEDVNSHWLIKSKTDEICNRGEAIKCDSVIRLEHLSTKKNLHSHLFASPLSGGQEVSAYGDKNGNGDTGDHWQLICQTDSWQRDDSIILKHVDTDMYLAASGRSFSRPISGQMEIVGVPSLSGSIHWKAAEGLFVHQSEPLVESDIHHAHTEL